MSKVVQNYHIKEIKPNLSTAPFADKHKKILEGLLTDRKESCVEFDLIGVNDKIANALRRTIIDELEVVALDFDPQELDTNDEFILRDEVRDRIRFIPIDQTLKEGSRLTLESMNKDPKNGIMTVYSSAIGNSKIPKKFRVAELKPGAYLRIPNIVVRRGTGRDDAMFSLSCDIFYDNLDYMDVHFINNKANILTRRVSVAELMKVMSKEGFSASAISKRALVNKKILVIPNPAFSNLLTDRDRKRVELAGYDYKVIFKNPGSELEAKSSSMVSSREFHMRVYLMGQIPPEDLLPTVCDNLINRLEVVKKGVEEFEKNGTDPSGIIDITSRMVVVRDDKLSSSNQTLTSIRIRGETHTLGEMLVSGIYFRDPGIMNIKKRMNHPSENQVFIDIIHPNPIRILKDTIDDCVAVLKNISSAKPI